MENNIISVIKKSVVILSTMSLLLAGCGSSSAGSMKAEQMAAPAAMMGNGAYDDMYMAEEAYAEYEVTEEDSADVTVNDTSRKLIKNVNMSAETDNLDQMLAKINARIEQYGGYVEYSNIDNGSAYSNYRYQRSANYTIRIPSKNLDAFLSNVAEFSNITSKNVSVSDVTLQYVDVEARKASLETEQKRLLELMEEAVSIEDIITIEERLSEVRYELESAERQIRSYDNQVDYSTVIIDINEVKEYTPVEEVSRLEKIRTGFVSSVEGVIEDFLDFGTGFVIALPYIIVWVIIILIIVLIIRGIVKSSKKRAIKKREAQLRQNTVMQRPVMAGGTGAQHVQPQASQLQQQPQQQTQQSQQ